MDATELGSSAISPTNVLPKKISCVFIITINYSGWASEIRITS